MNIVRSEFDTDDCDFIHNRCKMNLKAMCCCEWDSRESLATNNIYQSWISVWPEWRVMFVFHHLLSLLRMLDKARWKDNFLTGSHGTCHGFWSHKQVPGSISRHSASLLSVWSPRTSTPPASSCTCASTPHIGTERRHFASGVVENNEHIRVRVTLCPIILRW